MRKADMTKKKKKKEKIIGRKENGKWIGDKEL